MVAVFAGMVALAGTYPAEASFLPFVIGIPGIVLCAVQLLLDLRTKDEAPRAERQDIRRELTIFAWLIAFLAGLLLFGFVYATPVLLFAFLRIGMGERLAVSLTGAAIGLPLVYVVFELLLEIPLYEGFAAAWLG
jgi:hypothetical protein